MNKTSESRPNGTTSYSHNADDELISAAGPSGTVTYVHDANGNMTRAGSREFVYDLAGRMRSTTKGSETTRYTYDGRGKRLKASWGDSPNEKTKFLWDVNSVLPQLAIERDGAGSSKRRYAYGLDLLSMSTGGTTSYYHHDALGSVSNLTSSSGAPQWAYSYEPYGATRTETKVDSTAPENPMKFAGEYADPTGLYHLRARQYQPDLGIFSARDPLPLGSGDPYVSPYTYANSQPTVFVDPSGMICILGSNPNGSCRGSGVARGTWEGIKMVSAWTWDHRWQVGTLAAAGICAFATAGLCLPAVGTLAGLKELEIIATADCFSEFAVDTLWNFGTAGAFAGVSYAGTAGALSPVTGGGAIQYGYRAALEVPAVASAASPDLVSPSNPFGVHCK